MSQDHCRQRRGRGRVTTHDSKHRTDSFLDDALLGILSCLLDTSENFLVK